MTALEREFRAGFRRVFYGDFRARESTGADADETTLERCTGAEPLCEHAVAAKERITGALLRSPSHVSPWAEPASC
ncbi:hypothetical protein SAMN04487948_105218 [Halogranum amylolyticum]|uniref:Uncharacterized protein n=1 Tax=Halogranum amylolyticum TaxID=660520 RepID=A0A1H8SP51_9EURY|nr:hypothetical protein [Halogranum amylolyticum]SEO80098.1 hypothetical protein SAMN04487948_105218 [Halogranum amylolyticum]